MLKKRKRRKVNRRHTEPGLGAPGGSPTSNQTNPILDSGIEDIVLASNSSIFGASGPPMPEIIKTSCVNRSQVVFVDGVSECDLGSDQLDLTDNQNQPSLNESAEMEYSRLYRCTRLVCPKRKARRFPKPLLVPVPSAPSVHSDSVSKETFDSDELEETGGLCISSSLVQNQSKMYGILGRQRMDTRSPKPMFKSTRSNELNVSSDHI